MDLPLPDGHKPARFDRLYSELALYQTLVRAYTKPLFAWRKALSRSHDGRTLYDFARHTPQNAERLHQALREHTFRFRDGIALHYNFNGRARTIYLFPWEERIVDLLLYRMLNRHFHSALSNHCYAYRHRGFGVDFCQRRIGRALARAGGTVYGFKRDMADYFASIDHDILLGMLARWIEPDDYLFDLVQQRVRFRVREDDHVETATRGVAFGTAIACFLANLYLTPVDRAVGSMRGLDYFRYGDDVLALSGDRGVAAEAMTRFDRGVADLELQSKPSHHISFRMSPDTTPDERFPPVRRFRHLGLEFRADGSIGLPRDKFRKLRNLFRFAFRRARRRLRHASTPEQRAEIAVAVARRVIEHGFRSVAIIDYYLKHVDDEAQLRLLDRWLAEEVLAVAFEAGHKKGHFRRISFARLRAMGLPSLRHRHRLLRHGHLTSSFFVWRTERLIENERGRLPGRSGRARTSGASGDLFSVSRSSGAKQSS